MLGRELRVIGLPPGSEDYPDFPSESTFEKCVGRVFAIGGFNQQGMAELDIEAVNGSVGETIWIELRFLEVVLDED